MYLSLCAKEKQRYYYTQAYDGHMNLIMSDVEETIMLVDTESVANGQGVVNVCFFFFLVFIIPDTVIMIQ